MKTLPQQESKVRIKMPSLKESDEYTLQVYAYTREANDLLPAHYDLAKEQFVHEGKLEEMNRQQAQGNIKVETQKNNIVLTVGGIKAEINKQNGALTNYAMDGVSALHNRTALEPYFWRAPNDNDYGNKMPQKSNVWRSAQTDRYVSKCQVGEPTEEGVLITFDMVLSDLKQPYHLSYLFRKDGSIDVKASMDTRGKKLPELPRFGMRMTLPKGFENVSYYGRGPWENYSDRKTSQFIGLYHTTVTDMYYPYIFPQQTGNHCDVRWAEIASPQSGITLRFQAEKPMDFSALHFADEDLDMGLEKKMMHQKDMHPRQETYVILDGAQRGVGGDNSWGEPPHKEYRLFDGEYSLAYRLTLKK